MGRGDCRRFELVKRSKPRLSATDSYSSVCTIGAMMSLLRSSRPNSANAGLLRSSSRAHSRFGVFPRHTGT